jgi:hypothetical protein
LFETGLKTTDLGLYDTGTIVSWKVDKWTMWNWRRWIGDGCSKEW